MRQIKTNIKSNSKEFRLNYDNYIDLLITHKSMVEQVYNGARTDAVEKYISRGKLLARQRIDLLVDEQTPFRMLALSQVLVLFMELRRLLWQTMLQ